MREGEYLAIVGNNSCGNSILVRLRRSIGGVMRDGRLLLGSIQLNITISMPLASVVGAWEAAETTGVVNDIRKMPMT